MPLNLVLPLLFVSLIFNYCIAQVCFKKIYIVAKNTAAKAASWKRVQQPYYVQQSHPLGTVHWFKYFFIKKKKTSRGFILELNYNVFKTTQLLLQTPVSLIISDRAGLQRQKHVNPCEDTPKVDGKSMFFY